MTEFRSKSLGKPDVTKELPGIKLDIVELGDMTVAKAVHEPGWRWSTHVKPMVGGEWCRVRHVGYIVSGRLGIVLEDGASFELGPNDVMDVPPGHDGYTIGHEPCVLLEWAGVRAFTGFTGTALVLATLLLTEVVDADTRASELGEAAWRDLLSTHLESTRERLELFRGREVGKAGGGIIATFEGPAQALRCASEIRRSARANGLRIRAGVHVGEVELVDGGVRGPAVTEATRIVASAGGDEILASETTRVLAMASGLDFEDRGDRDADGAASGQRLYAYAAEGDSPAS
jgi:class 3 adenylate cyclase